MADSMRVAGLDKASILTLCLGAQHGQKLIEALNDEELKALSRSIIAKEETGSVSIDMVFRQFLKCFETADRLPPREAAQSFLLTRIPEEQLLDIKRDLGTAAKESFWEQLNSINEEILAAYLKNEYPQTICLVLSMLKPNQAAKVVGQLPGNLAVETLMRMLTMETVSGETLRYLQTVLLSEFMSTLTSKDKRDSFGVVANILNNSDSSAAIRMLNEMRARDAAATERVQARMFTFNDLPMLAPASIQTLLGAVPKETLALALKGTSEDVRSFFYSQMSTRLAKMLAENIQNLGPVKMRQVEEAQASILSAARELADRGIIDIEVTRDENLIE